MSLIAGCHRQKCETRAEPELSSYSPRPMPMLLFKPAATVEEIMSIDRSPISCEVMFKVLEFP